MSRKAVNMPVLYDYEQFNYVHRETGTLASALSHAMDSPISEALLFGISGGIVIGYQMSDDKIPTLNLLTRTPFTPFDTIIERLKLPTDDRRTSNPERAERYLHEALDDGQPVIVWVDVNQLPYTLVPVQHSIQPVIVYGIDDEQVYIVDRASVPLVIDTQDFQVARNGAASERYRQMTLGIPQMSRLALAVRLGIESCLRDFLEEPPLKNLRGKFGLAAYDYWANKVDSSTETGWRKSYRRGRKLASVLVSGYRSINFNMTGGNGSRAMFADFLDEAAEMLDKPMLKENAEMWRETIALWNAVSDALLPDDVPEFKRLRRIMHQEHDLFITQGIASIKKRQAQVAKFDDIYTQIGRKFPMKKRETIDLFDNLHDVITQLQLVESAAVEDLKAVMLAVSV